MSDLPRPLPGDAPAEPDPMIGRVLADRYRMDGLLARGGMARVYRARDDRLERDVAVKILSPPYADDPEFTTRFLAEARAAASLSHPSLVHVYDSGSDGSAHFIVMELLDNHRSLRQELAARGGRLPREEVLRMGQELLAGLRVVHERGLVHCDVKPANIMLGPGPAKLIDFGIARSPHEAIEGETSIGSLHFMSPEHLHGRALAPASDLFSLAVVLYEALSGRVPFAGETPDQVSAAQSAGVRPPSTIVADVPGRLDEAILQGLRLDPANRFHTADAMGRALASVAEEPTPTPTSTPTRRDDTTVSHPVAAATAPAAPRGGYVPPPAQPAPRRQPAPRPPQRPPQRPPSSARAGRGSIWSLIGTLAILAAAGAVVVLAVMLIRDAQGGAGPGAAPSESAAAATPNSGVVVVPNTVGMPTPEAIAAAQAAGLNWTVYCNHDESRPEGIIDQEPPAGTEVGRGSAFSMYSARIADCP